YLPLQTEVSLYCWEPVSGQSSSNSSEVSQGHKLERISEVPFDECRTVDFLGPYPFFLLNAGQELFYGSRNKSANSSIQLSRENTHNEAAEAPGKPTTNDKELVTFQGKHMLPPTTPKKGLDSDVDSILSSLSSSRFSQHNVTNLDGHDSNEKTETDTPSKKKKGSNRRHWVPPILVQDSIAKPITAPKPIKLQIDFTNKSFFRSLATNEPEDVCVSVFYNGEFTYSKVFRAKTLRSISDDAHPTIAGRRVAVNLEVPWVVSPINTVRQDTSEEKDNLGPPPPPSLDADLDETINLDSPQVSKKNSLEMQDARTMTGEQMKLNMDALFRGNQLASDQATTAPMVPAISKAESRWNEINQSLLSEAEEWGREGVDEIFRTPVGEYLEEVAKLPFPKNAKSPDANSRNIGVMDVSVDHSSLSRFHALMAKYAKKVIISLGRSIILADQYKSIREPQRKLTQARIGPEGKLYTVPKEMMPQTLEAMIASFQDEERSRPEGVPKTDRKIRVPRTSRTVQISTQNQGPNGTIKTDSRHGTQAQNVSLESTGEESLLKSGASMVHDGPTTRRTKPDKSARNSMQPPTMTIGGNIEVNAMDLKAPPHPKAPKNVPQKTYKDPRSGQALSAPPELEFPSHSTRSRTTAGNPSAIAPASSQHTVDSIRKTPRRRTMSLRLNETCTSTSHNKNFSLDGSTEGPGDWQRQPTRFSDYLYTTFKQLEPIEIDALCRGGTSTLGYDGPAESLKSSTRKRVSSQISDTVPKAKSVRLHNLKEDGNAISQSKMNRDGALESGVEKLLVRTIEEREPLSTESFNKRKRHQMSDRELSALLSPHKPSKIVYNSLGQSFEDQSSARSTRNAIARQQTTLRVTGSQRRSRRVTAIVEKGRKFIVKGLRPGDIIESNDGRLFAADLKTLGDLVGSLPSQDFGKAFYAFGIEASFKAQRPTFEAEYEQVSKNLKEDVPPSRVFRASEQPTVATHPTSLQSLNNLESRKKTSDSLKEQATNLLPFNSQLSSAAKPDMSLQTLDKPPASGVRQAKVKPGLTIQPELANAATSRSYNVNHLGLKTPTPRSGTFPVVLGPPPSACTRSSNRKAVESLSSFSSVSMAPLVVSTPAKNDNVHQTPSSRPATGLSSSPNAIPETTPSLVRQSRIPLPQRVATKHSTISATGSTDVPNSSHHRNHSIVSSVASEIFLPLAPLATSEGPSPHKKTIPKPKTSRVKMVTGKSVPSLGWRPTVLCQDSVLSYVAEEQTADLLGLEYDARQDNFCRVTRYDRENVFRASGILMGVRYVFGLELTK
ncbi:SET domain protein, partial [Diplocarpon rosae]